MKKFFVKTLGCKTNQFESEVITDELVKSGFVPTKDLKDADIFIVNSCAVTQNAVAESLYYLKNIKKKYPNIITVLTGCTAQLPDFKNTKKNIDYILGNNEKLSIAEFLNSKPQIAVNDIFKLKEFNNRYINFCTRTRANLKIQDGCNCRCSYCTIPLVRGNSRSNCTENILKQIELFVSNGVNEIILTGIHIGQWGLDFPNQQNLIDLLKEIEKTEIKRIRLGSLDTLEITDELLDFLKNSKKFCPHFHISIQSMSDKILLDMGRKYTSKMTLDLIKKIRSYFPDIFLGCDIITGFPSETIEDFEECYENLKQAELSRIHVFPFSERKNTKASLIKNIVSENDKVKRTDMIKRLSKEKIRNFLQKNLSTIHEVQIQKNIDKKTNMYKGTTRNYIDVFVNSDIDIRNRLVNVRLTELKDEIMLGEINE